MDDEAAPQRAAQNLEPPPLGEVAPHEQDFLARNQALTRALHDLAHRSGHRLPDVLADHLGWRLADDAHRLRVQILALPFTIEKDDAVTQLVDDQPEMLGHEVPRAHAGECGPTSCRRDIRAYLIFACAPHTTETATPRLRADHGMVIELLVWTLAL